MHKDAISIQSLGYKYPPSILLHQQFSNLFFPESSLHYQTGIQLLEVLYLCCTYIFSILEINRAANIFDSLKKNNALQNSNLIWLMKITFIHVYIILINFHMCGYFCLNFVCAPCVCSSLRGQKWALDFWDWSDRRL